MTASCARAGTAVNRKEIPQQNQLPASGEHACFFALTVAHLRAPPVAVPESCAQSRHELEFAFDLRASVGRIGGNFLFCLAYLFLRAAAHCFEKLCALFQNGLTRGFLLGVNLGAGLLRASL